MLEKMVLYITDDLDITSGDSDKEQIKTKYPTRSFLTKMCKIVGPQKRVYKSFSCFLTNRVMFKAYSISQNNTRKCLITNLYFFRKFCVSPFQNKS